MLVIVVVAAIYDARNKPCASLAGAGFGRAERRKRARPSTPTRRRPSSPGTSVHRRRIPPGRTPSQPDATAQRSCRRHRRMRRQPPASAARHGVAEIKLAFDDESWVEIKDGTGDGDLLAAQSAPAPSRW